MKKAHGISMGFLIYILLSGYKFRMTDKLFSDFYLSFQIRLFLPLITRINKSAFLRRADRS